MSRVILCLESWELHSLFTFTIFASEEGFFPHVYAISYWTRIIFKHINLILLMISQSTLMASKLRLWNHQVCRYSLASYPEHPFVGEFLQAIQSRRKKKQLTRKSKNEECGKTKLKKTMKWKENVMNIGKTKKKRDGGSRRWGKERGGREE